MKPITAVWPGRPDPRGAHWDGEGVNFGLFSEHAEGVDLCIFDATGRRELQRVPLSERTDQVWHCYLPEARPGMLYGYRVHGPYRPEEGQRFNANKLLLDPYARNIVGALRWSDALFGYTVGHKRADLSFDRRDSANAMPKCKIIDSAFTWGEDRRPDVPWHDMVIYELHVRGFTIEHPDVPPALRGTYAGLATAPVIEYLQRLSVTTVELMPVHTFVDDRRSRRAGTAQLLGLQHDRLFRARRPLFRVGQGERVQDDGEDAALGRDRGDPGRRLQPHGRRRRARPDAVLPRRRQRVALPAARRRSAPLHGLHRLRQHARHAASARAAAADGFAALLGHRNARRRLPLRSRLRTRPRIARGRPPRRVLRHPPAGPGAVAGEADRRAVGPGRGRLPGRQLPAGLGRMERQVPRHDARLLERRRRPDRRVRASPHRIVRSLRPQRPQPLAPASTSSLRTTASRSPIWSRYNGKHNEANLEENRDGVDHNLSWNCGAEGPTDDPAVTALRGRQKRNLLATLLLSQGVPMLLAGDEIGRTQQATTTPTARTMR